MWSAYVLHCTDQFSGTFLLLQVSRISVNSAFASTDHFTPIVWLLHRMPLQFHMIILLAKKLSWDRINFLPCCFLDQTTPQKSLHKCSSSVPLYTERVAAGLGSSADGFCALVTCVHSSCRKRVGISCQFVLCSDMMAEALGDQDPLKCS